jgi:hypothetical protein
MGYRRKDLSGAERRLASRALKGDCRWIETAMPNAIVVYVLSTWLREFAR